MPALVARSELIEEFAEAVATKLPEGVSVPAMDSIQSILAAEGEGLALLYVMASQYTQATELATNSLRDNLGIDATYGEFVGGKDWLQTVWMAYLVISGDRLAFDRTQRRQPKRDPRAGRSPS